MVFLLMSPYNIMMNFSQADKLISNMQPPKKLTAAY